MIVSNEVFLADSQNTSRERYKHVLRSTCFVTMSRSVLYILGFSYIWCSNVLIVDMKML